MKVRLGLLLLLVATPAARADETESRLRQIGLCLAMYADLHEEFLPPMKDARSVMDAVVGSVTSDDKIFYHPQTGKLFQPNPHMTGHKWQDDPDALLFFEASAVEDGSRAALFNDGHVERLPKAAWESLQKKLKLPAGPVDPEAAPLENLRQLGAAILLYAQDGDKTLPPLDDLAATRKALLPYAGMKDVFTHPATRQPYQPNPSLSGKKLAAIANPAATVIFYEAQPTDDQRAILFLDGHAERLPESKWTKLKETANIP